MEETISLKEIFQTIKKRLGLIILLTVVAVAAAAIISYFYLTPMYQSSTQVLVNQSKEEGQAYTQGDIRTNLELINTYNVIIKSPAILEPVREELGLNRGSGSLGNQITVGSEGNSQVIYIRVQDENPAMAVQIANTVASVFQREIVNIMNVNMNDVSILSSAVLSDNPSPVSPNPPLNIAIALVVGLMAGVGLAFLLEFLDNTLKSEDQLEKALGIPVLGAISTIDDKNVELKKLTVTKRARTGRENIGA
ncbi:Wzz/FepE/Etk N-terminal domain-containing protein [Evansella sp. AB-P1]|uniref:YveK family protein n=1 Tax=Evansella sp. AB-P1 TaxID=3037653 RepID=UPI00241FEAA9|nr:Wzz/FepE/Etk N-terminal domain-containing protein [Evansella sp. AB-P1]MDG5789293.1 Wzz/FepE/Etk N-terminal domain-containing protein [Evansella sp. AB-P1]